MNFGGLAYAITGLSPVELGTVARRFAGSPGAGTNGCLHFAAGPASSFPRVDTAGLEETFELSFEGQRLAFRGRLARGVLRASGDRTDGEIQVAPVDAANVLGVVENVLRMATALCARARGGLMLHSGAVAMGTEAIILVGRSGSGKSTSCAAAHRNGRRVLSDELNILTVDQGTLFAMAVPFAGDFGEPPQESRFKVRAIFLLAQGGDHVRPVVAGRAVASLVAAAPFVNCDGARSDELLATAAAIVRALPVQELSLAFGSDPWQVGVAGAA